MTTTRKQQISVPDIWTVIEERRRNKQFVGKSLAKEYVEKNLLVIGYSDSGKSTLIQKFANEKSEILPTVALEYSFVRYEKSNKNYIVHIWELADGTQSLNLLDDVLENSLHSITCVAIVINLMKPELIFTELMQYIKKLKSLCEKYFATRKKEKSRIPEKMEARAKQRFGNTHPDLSKVSLLCVPTVIIGTHYDEFEMLPEYKKNIMNNTLRFIAHWNGSGLIYTGLGGKGYKSYQKIMENLLYGEHISRDECIEFSINKPLAIRVGQDSFEKIGNPPSSSSMRQIEVEKTGNDVLDQFQVALLAAYGLKGSQKSANVKQEIDLKKYEEPAIDEVRKQKDEELKRYKKELEKRSRLRELNQQK